MLNRYARIQFNLNSLKSTSIICWKRNIYKSSILQSSKRVLNVSELDLTIPTDSTNSLKSECLNLELGYKVGNKKLKKKSSKAGNMITYIHSMMIRYPDSIILTRVGSFYELYFHQAIELGPILNLRIGRKNQISPVNGESYVPMAGFPFYQLQTYLKAMVGDLKKTVVLLDQVPSEVIAGSNESEKRPITRIITAGTLVGESFLNASENNYIAAIQFTNTHLEASSIPSNSPVGIAWLDISVGTFYFQLTTVTDLMSELVRINPKEILLDTAAKRFEIVEGGLFSQLSELKNYMITYKKFPTSTSFSDYLSRFNQPPAEVLYSIKDADEKSISAMSILLKYISENIPGSIIKLKIPEHQIPSEYMRIDGTTRKGLELFESNQNNDAVKGTLYNVINRTVTQSGARLLRTWLSSPLLSIDKITKRQNLVEYFINNRILTTHITHSIQRIDDSQRTIQKLGMQKFDAMDLVGLARSISIISDIHKLLRNEIITKCNARNDKTASVLLEWFGILNNRLISLQKLAKSIEKSIDIELLEINRENEEAILEQEIKSLNSESISPEFIELQRDRKAKREAGEFRSILKESASKSLKKLSIMQNEYISEMEELDRNFKSIYPSLKVSLKWAPQYGYHVHITATEQKLTTFNSNLIEGHQIKPTKKTIVIQNEEWIQLGLKKDYIQGKREEEERKILTHLRQSALESADNVRECCSVLDEIDVTTSFAILANEQSLVKPTITDDYNLNIINGRHLTVEAGLKSNGINFTTNDCNLGGNENNIWVITGPNMGGKSTFIRQVALITILAQIGCFVPCSSATIGLVDRIFCRIGAGDDLYHGRSTFMVEMLETGNILKYATNRSLAILDEVGRGTSGRDGLAISYATLVHLLDKSKCRSLYATHFGLELGKLLESDNKYQDISFYQTSIRPDFETDSNTAGVSEEAGFFFDHKLEKGISQNSHGLKIAAMAGFPPSVLTLAESAWKRLGE